MNKNSPGNRLLSRAEVAELFGVSPSTVTRWADAGLIPTTKTLGGHRRYDATVINELMHQFREETIIMEDLILGLPTMWADHHVLTVRNTLLALDGIEDVQASSAFKTVKVTFDSSRVSSQIIVMALLDAGYAPAGFNGSVINVPVSNGKADPGWTVLATRAIQTNPADMAMSGEFRKY
ncbi:MAG: helix-turn-helix domain-containing protein [Anaerolineae bacterium]|nr:helix-turn-helix domain-containing protein [Anaerolineae bacterium]MCB9129324.1 helix-turn-helix domain-containing protein [Anaerolineales bacterium]MCB0230751.1 helix-turn-helix domain-containing protein [Anaerolineae bacterium]MCB0233567.1 helix-turn-helix domain-containing protein [Anaerolineae bacterium]MCB0238169.1 helix-turn-helix domain-containing protein [Anaerolineae bacterium]